jgi:penicillin-binding protein 2
MLGDGIGSNIRRSKLINRRMFIASTAKAVVFFGIVSRLFYLQVEQNKKYLTLSDKNRIRENKLPPIRGEFKDYFGKTIAGNLDVYELHVIPEQVEDFRVLIMRVKQILNLTDKDVNKIYKVKNKQKPWKTIIVSDNLSWNQFSKINYYLYDLPGLKPVISVGRSYPYNESYSHVLGYVAYASQNDLSSNEVISDRYVPGLRVGKNGLEKTFETELIGTNTIQRFEVNAYGKRINQLEVQNGNQGNSLRISIDTEIQNYTTELLRHKAGSISIMDIYTGEIVAMNSSPSFNPNDFLYGIGSKEWKDLNANPSKPLVNKTISGLYSPGSTIKPLVALSALEHDVIKPSMTVRCTDTIDFYGQKFHCWKKKGHGYMTLKNAIKQSCDIYFYEVARLLGVDRLNETARKFGLGNIVLKDFFDNEKKGVVPSTKWKKEAIGQNWYLGETLITGIGQGYIQTTPLQLTLMTAQLANGGNKIYPTIIPDNNKNIKLIKKQMENNEDLNFPTDYPSLVRNKENVKFVLDGMFRSTNEIYGTSYSSRIEDPKYQFAGKTGTAQVKRITEAERDLDLKLNQIPYKERDHAWYTAFGPYKNPRYALTVLVEHGGSGSSVAAPIAKKLFKKIIDRHEVREKIRIDDTLIS